jgi:glycosyltransferase involved in cell wall biosynthesis
VKVLVLSPAPYDTSPALRFRIEQWARHLEPLGFRFTFVPFEDAALRGVIYQPGRHVRKAALTARAIGRRFAFLPRIRDYDVVLIHREAVSIGPAILERLIARKRVPIVFDFDDPIWLTYRSPTNGILSYLKWPSKVAGICRLATVVTVGNRLLAEWAGHHSRRVEVVPSTVDMDRCPAKTDPGGTTPTLGWTGSHSTLPFLENLLPVLRSFAAKKVFRLLVISHTNSYRPPDLPIEVNSIRWQAETEGKDLLGMDVGLAPFPNTGWTPWRCHGKVLQYMAAGIPPIASRLGILPDYIQDGENGYLASTNDEWLDRLGRLADSPDLRQQLGRAARQTIAEHFSVQVWAPRFRDILMRAVSGTSNEAPQLSKSKAGQAL